MSNRRTPETSILVHESVKKVISVIHEVPVDPDYVFVAHCPYCNARRSEEIFDDNYTIKVNCWDCKKDYKIKVPKFL